LKVYFLLKGKLVLEIVEWGDKRGERVESIIFKIKGRYKKRRKKVLLNHLHQGGRRV